MEEDRLHLVHADNIVSAGGVPTLRHTDGRCVFRDAAGRRCRLQLRHGHAALPLACRQFPRITVIDPRGPSITLSHYCPTARALLASTSDFAIVDTAPAFPAGGEYEGLDVSAALPPLLRPDMLMDWVSWWHWETLAVGLFAADDDLQRVLGRLHVAVEAVAGWRPGDGGLDAAVSTAFARARTSAVNWRPPAIDDVVEDVVEAIPEGVTFDRPEPGAAPAPAILRRYLAAHAFANWTAHLGTGLHAWLRSLEAAYVLASHFGIRQADLWLRHLTDSQVLAQRWSKTVPGFRL